MELQTLLLPLFFFWALVIILLLFRYDLAWFWRLTVLVVFLFYALWFGGELLQGWKYFLSDFDVQFLKFLKEMMRIWPLLLLLLWPMAICIAYNSNSTSRTEKILRNMMFVTLVYWLYWISRNYLDFQPASSFASEIIKDLRNMKLPDPP